MQKKVVKVEFASIDDIKSRAKALQKDLNNLLSVGREANQLKNKATKMISQITDTINAQQKDINNIEKQMRSIGLPLDVLRYYNDQVGEVLQEAKRIDKMIKS